MVKTTRHDAGDRGTVEHLHREQVAMGMLAGVGVSPVLLAADNGVELVVMTDVGGPSLESMLLGPDPEAATAAVVGLGEALGRLHGTTIGKEDEYLGAMDALGSPRPAAERYGTWTGVNGWDDIVAAVEDLGLPSPHGVRGDVAEVRRQLENPGPFLALAHTDPSPPNVLVTPAGVVLVDFEGSGFRHVGLDLAWLHFPFPNYSAHYAVLPKAVVEAADAAYRAHLTEALPISANDDVYQACLCVGLAAALIVRTQRLRLLASHDQEPYDSWRRRTQLVQQIGVFTRQCALSGLLPALATWFDDLALELSARWADAGNPQPPLFPALDTPTGN